MREAFEQAILESPDELANSAAYADWLQEQGDPRGEFIRVQLALEDDRTPTLHRDSLRVREQELLLRHQRDWLGELAPHLLDRGEEGPRHQFHWQRGFLSVLRSQCLTRGFAQQLATAPEARFLRELRIEGAADYYDLEDVVPPPPRGPLPRGIHENRYWGLIELIGAPCLRNLRVFQMGDPDDRQPPEADFCDCHTYAPGLEHVVAGMPRVEELHLLCKEYDIERLFALPNLRHLRVLRLYHFGARDSTGYDRDRYEYPLDVLAANPALGELTHLLFHPHGVEAGDDEDGPPSFLPLDQVRALVRSPHLGKLTHLQLRLSSLGDEGVRLLIDSGMLRRLKWLDLRHGRVSDEGARLLAACPDLPHLEHLDLSRNAVTAVGLTLLQATGISVRADRPLTGSEQQNEQYLYEGDGE